MSDTKIRPLRRAEFHHLAELGYFDDDRLELLLGMVVPVSPPRPEHDESVWRLGHELTTAIGARAKVRIGLAFAASDISETLPDVVVSDNVPYWSAHPSRALLVVEVSRTSLRKDQGPKAVIYGGCAVDEYWIVNQRERCIEVYRDPDNGAWKTHARHEIGAVVTPLHFPDVEIRVADVLPPEGDVVPPDDDDPA